MQQQNGYPNRPNHFELKGSYFSLIYDKSLIDGQKRLTQIVPLGGISRTFSDDQISIHNSALGTQLTVTLEAVPDFMTTLLTVFIPSIQMPEDTVYPFKTIALVTKVRPALKDQTPIHGVAQSYLTYTLEGKAQIVIS